MPLPMQNSKPGAPKPAGAQPQDPFQQPALANAMMIGKTFTQMAPPGTSRPAGPGPKFPAQRGEGFQRPAAKGPAGAPPQGGY